MSGLGTGGADTWSRDAAAAVDVILAGVGELSVTWVPALRRWLALYSAAGAHPSGKACGIVARVSPTLAGGWSEPRLVMSNDYTPAVGVVYGGYTHTRLILGEEVYFTASFHTTYNVHLAKFNLSALFADHLTPPAAVESSSKKTLTAKMDDDDHERAVATPWSCKLFNCTCQGCADWYGILSGRGFGCTPPQAQTFWRAHKCSTNAKSGKSCDGPACSLPGHAPCQMPPGPNPPPAPAPPAPLPPLPPSGPPGTAPRLVWTTPTVEPSSEAVSVLAGPGPTGNQIIGGGQPIGNGNLVASVFPIVFGNATLHCVNTKASADGRRPSQRLCPHFSLMRGVSMFVNMATAMASDTSLVRMGMVTVQTQPDMFSGGQPAKFEQVFDAADASVTVTTDIATVRVWVDALTDAIFVHCNSTDGTRPLKLHVHVQSVRPPTNTTLGQPDVLASNASASVITISRRNEDADPVGVQDGFNTTLTTEGMGSLLGQLQPSDRWRHRQCGLMLSGAGGGRPLRPVNSSSLASLGGSSSFVVAISAHANQTDSDHAFHTQLASKHAAHRVDVSQRQRAHAGWWAAFWNASYIVAASESSSTNSQLDYLNRQYALTRYVQAIQARDSHWVPIKVRNLFFSNFPIVKEDPGPSSGKLKKDAL